MFEGIYRSVAPPHVDAEPRHRTEEERAAEFMAMRDDLLAAEWRPLWLHPPGNVAGGYLTWVRKDRTP